MNSFLNRVLAPGLRRVGSGVAYPQKTEPGIAAPLKTEPTIEEIVEEPLIAPSSPPSSSDDLGGRERFEVESIEERASRTPSNAADETRAGKRDTSAEEVSQPWSPESAVFLEEKIPSRPAPSGVPPIREERSKPAAETLSFEAIEFDVTVHPSMRRFQPPLEKRKADEALGPSKSDARPHQTASREIVWEVLPADRKPSPPKERVHQELRSEAQQYKARSSDPMQPTPSDDHSTQRPETDESAFDFSANAPLLPPRGGPLPRPIAKAKEEKGDLIIEQLEVRVVAEPERKPEAPKARRNTPKRSGAWETAARYYLGKV